MLYLYINVEPGNSGGLPHVLRSGNNLYGQRPDYDSCYCPSFTDQEDAIIRNVLTDSSHYNLPPSRGHYGWMRFPDYAVERLIIGCMACDIDLEIIKWEGK